MRTTHKFNGVTVPAIYLVTGVDVTCRHNKDGDLVSKNANACIAVHEDKNGEAGEVLTLFTSNFEPVDGENPVTQAYAHLAQQSAA